MGKATHHKYFPWIRLVFRNDGCLYKVQLNHKLIMQSLNWIRYEIKSKYGGWFIPWLSIKCCTFKQ